ncbi:MAG: YihY/virulence factor BrkB family protein [Verrucomicrobiae bacterium]|nr:YihY/virulence factor BrkB family protein [Verrucomicrobiae bacterium]
MLKQIFAFLKECANEWLEDKAPRLGAALAYYTVFSMGPLLIISVGLAGLIFGHDAAQGRIVKELSGFIGEQSSEALQTMIRNAHKPGAGIFATIVGTLTLLIGASAVFAQLQDALNTIWKVEPKPGGGVLGIIRNRVASFAMLLAIGFLLLVSLMFSAVVGALSDSIGRSLSISGPMLEGLNFILSLVLVAALFGTIYKILPGVRLAWRDVWHGALWTSVLFAVGKWLIGLYLGHSSVSSAYGAAGSLAVILIWVYYSAQILFFGAEMTKVYARKFGSGRTPIKAHFRPLRSSEALPEEDRELQHA